MGRYVESSESSDSEFSDEEMEASFWPRDWDCSWSPLHLCQKIQWKRKCKYPQMREKSSSVSIRVKRQSVRLFRNYEVGKGQRYSVNFSRPYWKQLWDTSGMGKKYSEKSSDNWIWLEKIHLWNSFRLYLSITEQIHSLIILVGEVPHTNCSYYVVLAIH